MQQGRPWYVPENLLTLKGHVVTPQEKKLKDFFLSPHEGFEKKWLSGESGHGPKKFQQLAKFIDVLQFFNRSNFEF